MPRRATDAAYQNVAAALSNGLVARVGALRIAGTVLLWDMVHGVVDAFGL